MVSQPAVVDWTVHNTPPLGSLGAITPATAETNQTQIVVNFSANEQSTFQCGLDQATPGSCSSPVTYNSLADGSHTVSVQATDLAGNIGKVVTYSWTVKTVPPTVTIIGS